MQTRLTLTIRADMDTIKADTDTIRAKTSANFRRCKSVSINWSNLKRIGGIGNNLTRICPLCPRHIQISEICPKTLNWPWAVLPRDPLLEQYDREIDKAIFDITSPCIMQT